MTPVLRCKAGVQFAVIAPGGFRLLSALDTATSVLKKDLLLTAGTNDHATGRHPLGEAYDVSVANLKDGEIRQLVDLLRQILGVAFGVWYEVPLATADPILLPVALVNVHASGPHVHCQVAKGTAYPPVERSEGTGRG